MKLDPGIGTELEHRAADEDGGLGRALRSVSGRREDGDRRARQPRRQDPRPRRRARSQVPRLTIHVPKDAAVKGITIDGAAVDSVAEPIVLEYPVRTPWSIRPRRAPETKIVPVERGAARRSRSTCRPRRCTSTTRRHRRPAEACGRCARSRPQPTSSRPTASAAQASCAIGVSSYLTLSARSKYNDALAAHCGGMANGSR